MSTLEIKRENGKIFCPLTNSWHIETPEEKVRQEYIKKLKSDITVSQYSGDFISISKNTNQPVYNSFIEIANERAWEVSQVDYQDKIKMYSIELHDFVPLVE